MSLERVLTGVVLVWFLVANSSAVEWYQEFSFSWKALQVCLVVWCHWSDNVVSTRDNGEM